MAKRDPRRCGLAPPRPDETWQHPLGSRYASREMLALFSDAHRLRTWRMIWVALAESQKALGLPVSSRQVAELKRHQDRVDPARTRELEEKFKHDVFAEIHAFGSQCPAAKGIIHWGATSATVLDNGDGLIFREALLLLRGKLLASMRNLADFARRHCDTVVVGYTHFQAAQFTTLGKRACLWLQDLEEDLAHLDFLLAGWRLRGLKGATGTQASFLALLKTPARVDRLEKLFLRKLGGLPAFPITGQTAPRKTESYLLALLSGLGQSGHRFANDVRLLAHLGELSEPFGKHQVGSSAMPFKRNPIRSERLTGLARYLINLAPNAAFTAAGQWLERTLDDSANRRLAIPEAFLACDALLELYGYLTAGISAHPETIATHCREALPQIMMENLMMAAVEHGADRQEVHELLRTEALSWTPGRWPTPAAVQDRLSRHAAFAFLRRHRLSCEPADYSGLAGRQTGAYLRRIAGLLKGGGTGGTAFRVRI